MGCEQVDELSKSEFSAGQLLADVGRDHSGVQLSQRALSCKTDDFLGRFLEASRFQLFIKVLFDDFVLLLNFCFNILAHVFADLGIKNFVYCAIFRSLNWSNDCVLLFLFTLLTGLWLRPIYEEGIAVFFVACLGLRLLCD